MQNMGENQHPPLKTGRRGPFLTEMLPAQRVWCCKPGVHLEHFYFLMLIFWGPYSDLADVNSAQLMYRTWSHSQVSHQAQECESLPRRTKWSIMFWQVQPHFLPAAPSVVTLEQLFQIMRKQAIDESPSRDHYLTRSRDKQNWKVCTQKYFCYIFRCFLLGLKGCPHIV